MFGSTMLLTVGHALDRAKEDGLVVRVNAGGEWITGTVLNADGHGVALLESNGGLCVVRQDAVTCVRLPVGGERAARASAGRVRHSGAASGSAALSAISPSRRRSARARSPWSPRR